jgi:hypothetical protein
LPVDDAEVKILRTPPGGPPGGRFPCLGVGHIRERHPDLLPDHREKIGETLADPDVIRRNVRMTMARLFSKGYNDLRNGRHVVVVVVSEGGTTARHWIVTAHIARSLGEGEVEWQRS